MDWTIFLSLALLGSCTGFMAGLLGIGGGMLLTPFLTAVFTIAALPEAHVVHVAIATSMSTILFTSMSSVRAHAKRGAVLWPVAKLIAPGILVGAIGGAQVAGGLSTFWISSIFACFVFFSSFKMIFGKKGSASNKTLPGPKGLFGAGTVIGLISSLVGAGGGFISVPFMTYHNVKIHNAVGTSAALGFPIALAGTIGYIISGLQATGLENTPYLLGYIHLPALLAVATTSVLTAPLGAKVAHAIDTRPLKMIFGGLLCVLASYMLYRAILAY